jgi:pilus assembly protein CpaB
VLAAGQKLQRTAEGDPQNASVVTLLVSPEDAQRLTLASQQGRIQLSLRNPLDTTEENLAVLRDSSLYRMTAEKPAEQPKPKVQKVAIAKAPPPPPSFYPVEMIKGDKREVTKF